VDYGSPAFRHLNGSLRRNTELGSHHHVDGHGGTDLTLAVGGDAGVLTPLLVAHLVEDQSAILVGHIYGQGQLGFLDEIDWM